jgi:hypothetical protein
VRNRTCNKHQRHDLPNSSVCRPAAPKYPSSAVRVRRWHLHSNAARHLRANLRAPACRLRALRASPSLRCAWRRKRAATIPVLAAVARNTSSATARTSEFARHCIAALKRSVIHWLYGVVELDGGPLRGLRPLAKHERQPYRGTLICTRTGTPSFSPTSKRGAFSRASAISSALLPSIPITLIPDRSPSFSTTNEA